ncbi:LolA family protein [Facilibium subflavum]|uniref:LolA family protein n=1 Tax=Facilibium subflavum TaxID=2219058 RepID=UPI000E6555FD|nr:outer membrane lipoprotein carrier protein LolA [Facilibium subflavum]
MKRFFFLAILTLFVCNVYADDSVFSHPLSQKDKPVFTEIQKAQAQMDHIRGDFTQTRNMKLLSRPLKSSGTFELDKSKELTWSQEKPFKSTLVVTDNEIRQSIEDNPPMIITAKEQPIVFAFTRVFLSIFKGNTAAIEQYFNIYFQGDAKHWIVGFKPKSSPLNKAITSIVMEGGVYASKITVNEAKGNQMIIEFSNVSSIKSTAKS